jgi:hypothetical protein
LRQLRSVSFLLVLAGLALIPVALLLDLSPTWTLTGLLLVWAGIVKVVVVHLWRGIAASGGMTPVAVDDN